MPTEIRTYTGLSGTIAFDGYAGLRLGQRYTGVGQEDGQVQVAAVGAPAGAGGVLLTGPQWRAWFT